MDFDVVLPSGRIRARRWGAPGAPLLLCVPGLSGNLCAYTAIAEQLGADDQQVVAIDLRGTGRSEITAPGSYGMERHAADVIGVADALDAEHFDLVGWSLGALIAMTVAVQAGPRLRSVTLIDHAGPTEPAALVPVRDGLARLDMSVDSPGDYLAAVRKTGQVNPWTPFWDAYHSYELGQDADGRWSPTTSRAAAEEDLRQRWPKDWSAYWRALTMPTTLVRALQSVNDALVVPQRAVEAMRGVNPDVLVVESPASDHYTCLQDSATVAAIRAGISAGKN